MSDQTEDGLEQIQESGRWLRYYGFYPIISVILLFVAVIAIILYLLSSITTSTTVNSQQFSNVLNVAILMIIVVALLIALGEIFILYKFYTNIRIACNYDLIEQETMQKTLLPLKIVIFLRLLSSIVPIIILVLYSISGTPLINVSNQDQLTQSSLTALQNTSYTRIINVFYNGILFYAMFVFHKWTQLIQNSHPSPMTNDAATGMNYVRISLGITALTSLTTTLSISFFLFGIIGFVGFILLIVGATKAGKALKYFTDLRLGNTSKYQMNAGSSYQSSPATQSYIPSANTSGSSEQITSDKTCPQCSKSVSGSSKFCQQCGYSFANQPTMMKPLKCSTCQSDLEPDMSFCATCGAKVS